MIKILIAIAIIILIFVVVAAMQPADFRVARSATISAPPAAVFEQVNDLHKFNEWSPFAQVDPNAKITFEGAPSGVGAAMTWSGNNQIGEGRMTITESHPNDLVRCRLDFQKPFKGTNIAEFTFQPEGDKTKVTWSMTGTKNFICKAMGLFMNCDKMCGDQFEKGLANLKSHVESPTAK